MVISKKKVTPKCAIRIGNQTIKQVTRFKYLESMLTSDGKSDTEIKNRMGMAKEAFQNMSKILKNQNITMDTRKRILACYIYPILTYGSESWTISPCMERRLEATEMWFYRRMLNISWAQHVRNVNVLKSK